MMDLIGSLQPPDAASGRVASSLYRLRRGNAGETSGCRIMLEPVDEQPVYRYSLNGKEIHETKGRSRKDTLNDRIREHANRLCSQHGDGLGVVQSNAGFGTLADASDAGLRQRNAPLFTHLARKLRRCYADLAGLTDMLNMCRPVETVADESSRAPGAAGGVVRNTTASRGVFAAHRNSSTEEHLLPYFLAQLSVPANADGVNDMRQFSPRKFDPFITIAPSADDLQASFAHLTRKKKTVYSVASTIASASSSLRSLLTSTNSPMNSETSNLSYPYVDSGPYADENTRRLAQRAMKAHMPMRSIINNIINADDMKRFGTDSSADSRTDNLQHYDCVRVPCSSPRFFYRFLLQLHSEYPLTSYTYRTKNTFLASADDADSATSMPSSRSSDGLKHPPGPPLQQSLGAEVLEITGLLGLTNPSTTSAATSANDHLARYTIVYDSSNLSQQVACYAPRFTMRDSGGESSLTPKTVRLVFEVINRDADERQNSVAIRAVITQPFASDSKTSTGKQQPLSVASTVASLKQKPDAKKLPSSLPSQNFQTDDTAASALNASSSVSAGYNFSATQKIFTFLHAKRAECFCVDSFRLLQRELAASSMTIADGGDYEVRNHGMSRFPPANAVADSVTVSLFGTYGLRIKLEECEVRPAKPQRRQQHDRTRHATPQSNSIPDSGGDNLSGALSLAISRALLAALMAPPPFLLSSRAVNAAGAVDFFTSPVLRGKHQQQYVRKKQQRLTAADRSSKVSGNETASLRILQYARQYLACNIVRQCVDEVATLNAPDPQLILRSTSVGCREGSIHAAARAASSNAAGGINYAGNDVVDDASNTVYRLRCYTSGFDHLNVKSGAFIVTIRQLDVVFHTRDGWTRSCRADCRGSVLNTLNMCCARYNSQLLLVYFSGLGWPCAGIRLMQPVVCTDFTDPSCRTTPILTLPPDVSFSAIPPTSSDYLPSDVMPPVASTITPVRINEEEALYYDYFVQVQNPRKDLHAIMQISVDRPSQIAMFIRPPKCVAITIAREKVRLQRKQGLLPSAGGMEVDNGGGKLAENHDADSDSDEEYDMGGIHRDWLNAPFIYPVCMFYDHVDNQGSSRDGSGYRSTTSPKDKNRADGKENTEGNPAANAADPHDADALAASDAATGRLQRRKYAWLDDADSIYESTLYYVALDQLFDMIDMGSFGEKKKSHSEDNNVAEQKSKEDAVARFARHVMDRMRGIDKIYQSSSSYLNKLDLFISSPMITNLE